MEPAGRPKPETYEAHEKVGHLGAPVCGGAKTPSFHGARGKVARRSGVVLAALGGRFGDELFACAHKHRSTVAIGGVGFYWSEVQV